MQSFYIIATIATAISLYLWVKQHSIVWWEAFSMGIIAFSIAGVAHFAAIKGLSSDRETFSGVAIQVVHIPWWKDRVRHTRTVTSGSGKNQTTRTEVYYTETSHPESWKCRGDFGSYLGVRTFKISKSFYNKIKKNFGGEVRKVKGNRPDFNRGDRNDYWTDNKTGFFLPMNTWVGFENRLKAGPSLYDFASIPKGEILYSYPSNTNPFKSNRLLGTAATKVSLLEWDKMNSRVGPKKKANIILIGFGDRLGGNMLAEYQKSAWKGGKKNDVVICYGGKDPLHPDWVQTFGWTDQELVKRNLDSLLMDNPVDTTIIPKVEAEIMTNYKIKEWKDFDYLEISPPGWVVWLYVLILSVILGGFLWWASVNEFYENNF